MADRKRPVVVLGVTGGIAAYKACGVVSGLVKLGAEVHVIMTANAAKLVSPLTFQTLSKQRVSTDTFEAAVPFEVEHIYLAQKADLFVIAPATANIMAKLAHGLADDMLSTTVLAARVPVLLAPAMNTAMWENRATKENLELLKTRGFRFIGPDSGLLACGDSGAGRMSEPEEIVKAAMAILKEGQSMAGLRVLVTAGPTREALDPVRFLTNRSSGKMGYAIAQEALLRGAEVTLVSGPVSLTPPYGARVIRVETTEDLLSVMEKEAAAQDIIVQAAAPADYRPVSVADQKIKKQKGRTMVIELTETPDVAARVGQLRHSGQVLVGFAAETEMLLDHAAQKLDKKNLDMIVANDVTQPGAGFDVDTNIVTLITRNDTRQYPLMSKAEVAGIILDRAAELIDK